MKFVICWMALPIVLAAQTAVPSAPVLYVATGANAAAIEATVERFRNDIGDLNPNVAQSINGGRREINWDGVGGTLGSDDLPGDFFNTTSPRGLIMSTPGTRLKVSGDPGTPAFLMEDVTFTKWGPVEFGTFSGSKFFAPMGSPITDIEFRLPGSNEVACTRAFGAVFLDVDRGGQSYLEVALATGEVRKFLAPLSTVKSKGMGFVGVRLPQGCIVTVRIVAGDRPVDTDFQPAPFPDGVGLDDFIYAEPRALTNQ
jgi:hypothetical protein